MNEDTTPELRTRQKTRSSDDSVTSNCTVPIGDEHEASNLQVAYHTGLRKGQNSRGRGFVVRCDNDLVAKIQLPGLGKLAKAELYPAKILKDAHYLVLFFGKPAYPLND